MRTAHARHCRQNRPQKGVRKVRIVRGDGRQLTTLKRAFEQLCEVMVFA